MEGNNYLNHVKKYGNIPIKESQNEFIEYNIGVTKGQKIKV